MSSSLNFFRNVYVRISKPDGKRSWEVIGFINEEGEFTLYPKLWAKIGPIAFKNPYANPGTGIPMKRGEE